MIGERNRPAASRPERSPTLPRPTSRYRRRAWRRFQQAIDPLGPRKPLRTARSPR